MEKKLIEPCFECKDRKPHCHSTCVKYKIACMIREKELEKLHEYEQKNRAFLTKQAEAIFLKNRVKYNEHGNRRN